MATPSDPAARRLARLRFDLHDGPQQEIHLLAEDLRRFRATLSEVLATHPDHDRALAALDDLDAQLAALDRELRHLITLADSPLAAIPFGDALAEVAEAFSARSGIVPDLDLHGDLTDLTASQQIALLSLVREGLSNVRQHASAEHVGIGLRADSAVIEVTVTDDGCGFAPERVADQAGHLGLTGMRERVAMLGGRTQISSAPGAGTTVRASLPRWARADGLD